MKSQLVNIKMDSSPDLSVKLRRGSSDSRDSFYMGFAQGIDSDIEEVTAPQAPIPSPPLYPPPEEPPINLPIEINEPELYEPEEFGMEVPLPVTFEHEELPESDVNVYEQQQSIEDNDDGNVAEVEYEKIEDEEEPFEVTIPDASPPPPPNEFSESNIEEQIPVEESEQDSIPPPPPAQFTLPTSSSIQLDEDEDETITSVTVIPTKSKTPSSSSSSISSNEYIIDESNINISQIIPPSSPLKTISPPPKPLETDFDAPISPKSIKSPTSARSPQSAKSPPSKKSNSSKKSPSISSLSQKSLHSHKSSPKSHQHAKSPPRKLEFHIDERQKQMDSDSIDSINAIDCKIDDDNRDSSPTDSMPPGPTPPPLEPLTLLEKR